MQFDPSGFINAIKKLGKVLLILSALPFVIIIRLISPFLLIRFGYLRSSRIGHFAPDTELYFCQRDREKQGKRMFDVFYYQREMSNQQLRRMWERLLYVCSFARWLDKANRLLPGGQNHIVNVTLSYSRDKHGLFKNTAPHLSFTDEEENIGKAEMLKLGIAKGEPFVCFHARSAAYLKTVLNNRNWNYHNYRDSSIYNYIPAMEGLTNKGYYAVRMGAVVKERLNTDNPRIIDYALNGRTDFMDIYLLAKCDFFIGDTAGIYGVAQIFRRPIVWVNFVPMAGVHGWGWNHLFIPKKLWLKKEKRFLTFKEILNSEIGRFAKVEQYEEAGIEVIENSPEEIRAVVMEMDSRLNGTWQETDKDEELQKSFWKLFMPNDWNQVFMCRIGLEFLRQNRELLE